MRSIRRAAPLLAVLALLRFGSLAAETIVPPERLALLSRGVNLSGLFGPWSSPASYATRFRSEDADFLKRAGITVCRLPLAPDFLFDPADPATPRPEIRYVDRAIRILLDAGIAVVFDPIHGDSSNADWERKLAHKKSFRAKAEAYWEALARHYAAFSADRIFFEVMNEPHLSSFETIDHAWWEGVQKGLAAAIRRGAPANTIIATGEKWGGIDGLLAIKPLADPNVVYSFHWYDPMAFTHQGASWAGPALTSLSGMPYPSSRTALAALVAALRDGAARSLALRYGDEAWDAARIRAGLERAAGWGARYKVPLFCGEFGVYKKVAPPEDRLGWIADTRRSLEALGIGWAMWDYDTEFGLVAFAEPGWRRGARVDPGNLAALGLDPGQSLEANPGKVTLADFASGSVQAFDIPVDAWTRLWTRGKGAGEETADEGSALSPPSISIAHRGQRDWSLGSGLRIPVRTGEELELASRAGLEGKGSLRLEFVARDAAGKELDWGYGSVAASAGLLRELVARVKVGPGIASLEPRWSGAGPIVARVEAFRVRRLQALP